MSEPFEAQGELKVRPPKGDRLSLRAIQRQDAAFGLGALKATPLQRPNRKAEPASEGKMRPSARGRSKGRLYNGETEKREPASESERYSGLGCGVRTSR